MLIECPAFESTDGGHSFTKAVDRRPDYQVNFVQFRYSWGFLHFRGFDCTQTYVNTFRTKQSVRNIVDGRFSGVSVRQGSTVLSTCNEIEKTQ